MVLEAIAMEGPEACVSDSVARLIETCSRGWERFLPTMTTTRRPGSCRVCRSGCLLSCRKLPHDACHPRGFSASGGVALARRRVWRALKSGGA